MAEDTGEGIRPEVLFASILMAMISAISALPGIIRERHVIHAPIKIKTIHHYKVKKVPLIIRKHVHVYKPREEVHLKPDHHSNHVFQEEEEDEGRHYVHQEFSPHPKGPPEEESSEDSQEAPEEDYEEGSHSQEEEEYE